MSWGDLRFGNRGKDNRNREHLGKNVNPNKKRPDSDSSNNKDKQGKDHIQIEKNLICPICGIEKPIQNFKINGKLDKFCNYCRNEIKSKDLKFCKSCEIYKIPEKFILNGIQNDICVSCFERIKCNKCLKVKYRFEFFWNGKKQKYCNKCMKFYEIH